MVFKVELMPQGDVLKEGRKDFAFGYLSDNNSSITHLALAIGRICFYVSGQTKAGGRVGTGRKSRASGRVTIVRIKDDMANLTAEVGQGQGELSPQIFRTWSTPPISF